MKLFSISLPNSKTIQSKYELEFGGVTSEGLSIQPLLSPEFLERLKRKILKLEIRAGHLNILPHLKIILRNKIGTHSSAK